MPTHTYTRMQSTFLTAILYALSQFSLNNVTIDFGLAASAQECEAS